MNIFQIAVSVGLVSSLVASASAGSVAEIWEGSMRQIEVNGEMDFPISVTFSGGKATSKYESLSCGGEWTRIGGTSPDYVIYKETITYGSVNDPDTGSCIDGVVIVSRRNGKLVLGWFANFEGEPILAAAELAKAAQ